MDASLLTRLGFVPVNMRMGETLQNLYDTHSVVRIVRMLQETSVLVLSLIHI
jgi:hypothetical protein